MPVRANGTTTFQVDSQRVAPRAKSGFALIPGHGEQNFAGDGNNVGNHHDGEDDARSEEADPVRGTLEKGEETERIFQARAEYIRASRE